ncbi:MAG: mannose-1-phosphate guanylyltransferase/mannose-6-phosphate isomerase [Rhizobiaceae bacterium]
MGIIPVILSGGSGTRLWPLSRRERPKQFLHLGQSDTFFQSTVKRCTDPIFDPRPIVVAADDHRFLVAENLNELGCEADILLEPFPRNSCAAILAGCLQAEDRDPDAVVAVLSADHLISDISGFLEAMKVAKIAAEDNRLVTFGIVPDHGATGYGYILPSDEEIEPGCFPVTQFVEKPDYETANTYISEGYLWNSGNFMFLAKTLLEEARLMVPELVDSVTLAYRGRKTDLDFMRLDKDAFRSAKPISIDYAIMERTDRAVVVPANHDWSDIGSWQSVWNSFPKTADGNVLLGDAKIVNGQGNLVHSGERLTTLVGVNDLIVVSTVDAVLVASMDRAEEIKGVVWDLENANRSEATGSRKVYRPWGSYDVIDSGEKHKVKRLEIKPGGVLSLQMHDHRAEHWIVVEGNPEITIGNTVTTYDPNQSVFIPKNTMHRLANHGTDVAVLIEVQTGDYLGEDDIIRFEDQYNRSSDQKS